MAPHSASTTATINHAAIKLDDTKVHHEAPPLSAANNRLAVRHNVTGETPAEAQTITSIKALNAKQLPVRKRRRTRAVHEGPQNHNLQLSKNTKIISATKATTHRTIRNKDPQTTTTISRPSGPADNKPMKKDGSPDTIINRQTPHRKPGTRKTDLKHAQTMQSQSARQATPITRTNRVYRSKVGHSTTNSNNAKPKNNHVAAKRRTSTRSRDEFAAFINYDVDDDLTDEEAGGKTPAETYREQRKHHAATFDSMSEPDKMCKVFKHLASSALSD